MGGTFIRDGVQRALGRVARIVGVLLSNADVPRIVEWCRFMPWCRRLLSERPQSPGVIAWLDEATVNEPAWCRKLTQHHLGVVGGGLVEHPREKFSSFTRSVLASFESKEVVPLRVSEVLFDQRQYGALLVFEVLEHSGREIQDRLLTVEHSGRKVDVRLRTVQPTGNGVTDSDEGRRYAGVLASHVVDLCPF